MNKKKEKGIVSIKHSQEIKSVYLNISFVKSKEMKTNKKLIHPFFKIAIIEETFYEKYKSK